MNRVLLVIVISIFSGVSANCRGNDPYNPYREKMDQFISQTMNRLNTVPGLAISVVKDEEMVYSQGFGYRDLEAKQPVTAETGFYIASSTKSFTALAATLLAREGKINLDDPINKYLPGLKLNPPLSSRTITIRDLLTHQSGLQNEAIVYRTAYSGQYTREKLLQLLNHCRAIDTTFTYSNLGYVITSLILDNISDESWKEVLKQNIFKPLKMDKTTAYVSETNNWEMAAPYTWQGKEGFKKLPFAKGDNTMHAAGGIISTVRDLAKWLLVQINEGRLEGDQIFPASVIRETHASQITLDKHFYRFHRYAYGLGWYISDYDSDTLLHHFGSFPGFRSHISFMPEHDLGVVALINDLSPAGFFLPDLIATYVYDLFLPKPNLSQTYQAEVDKFADNIKNFTKRLEKHLAALKARPQSPPRPLSVYEGTFENSDYGVLKVEDMEDQLIAQIGNLASQMKPYSENDKFRVELIPAQGQIISFYVNSASQADSIKYEGVIWRRADR